MNTTNMTTTTTAPGRPGRGRPGRRKLTAAAGLALLAGAGLAAASVAPVGAASAPSPHKGYFAILSGAAVVPPPGDPNGHGVAIVTLKAGQVCAQVATDNLGQISEVHIHQGPAGVSGNPVVDITPTLSGPSCVAAPQAVITGIRAHSARYYIQAHTFDFAGGAVRGQLQANTSTLFG